MVHVSCAFDAEEPRDCTTEKRSGDAKMRERQLYRSCLLTRCRCGIDRHLFAYPRYRLKRYKYTCTQVNRIVWRDRAGPRLIYSQQVNIRTRSPHGVQRNIRLKEKLNRCQHAGVCHARPTIIGYYVPNGYKLLHCCMPTVCCGCQTYPDTFACNTSAGQH